MGCHSWYRILFLCAITLAVAGCASNQPRADRADFAVMDQCLQIRQAQDLIQEQQQRQILETLMLVRDMLSLQQQSMALHQFSLSLMPDPGPAPECPPPEPEVRAAIDKLLVGEIENVLLTDLDLMVPARVDTGAATASLDARDIQVFERNSEDWVRFTIINPETGEPKELERRRVRRVRIFQAGSEDPDRRLVVEMRITLGNVTQMAEFTLSDRSHLEFPMLIGRNVLRDVMVVDISQSHLAPPVRPDPPAVNGRAAE